MNLSSMVEKLLEYTLLENTIKYVAVLYSTEIFDTDKKTNIH